MQALLEFDTPSMSGYHQGIYEHFLYEKPFESEANTIATSWLDKAAGEVITDGNSVSDISTMGIAFLNAAMTSNSRDNRSRFTKFAAEAVDYTMNLRTVSIGAINHRPPNESFQVWSDDINTIPPFLASWGSIRYNLAIAKEAHNQIKLYRELLRDPVTGLWRRGSPNIGEADSHFSGAGMSCVTVGMSRVLATYKHGPFTRELAEQTSTLASWASEILEAVFKEQHNTTGLLPMAYAKSDLSWDDPASSASFASAVYRLASLEVLKNEALMLNRAAKIRQGISRILDEDTGLMKAINSQDSTRKTARYRDSLAPILLMEAAVRDYRLANGCQTLLSEDSQTMLDGFGTSSIGTGSQSMMDGFDTMATGMQAIIEGFETIKW